MRKVTLEQFKEILPNICAQETSADPEKWTKENPLWGHCAIVALLAQSIFGGIILRASLTHIPELAYLRSHYWNAWTSGGAIDFTASQFGEHYPAGLRYELRSRDYLLSNADTANRYAILVGRFAEVLAKRNC